MGSRMCLYASVATIALFGFWFFRIQSGREVLDADTTPTYDLSTDPIIGTKLSFPPNDAFGRSIATAGTALLVWGGGCSSCSAHSVITATFPRKDLVKWWCSSMERRKPFRKRSAHTRTCGS